MYFLLTKEILTPGVLAFGAMGALIATYCWRMRRVPEGRRARAVIAAGYALLLALNTQAGTFPAMKALEGAYPPLRRRPDGVGAVVVLSGGIAAADSVRPRPELTEDTIFRCLHAAELYHQGTPLPVVVTGGKLDPASHLVPPVADLMRDLLLRLGVRPGDVVVEPHARTTVENAFFTRKILEARGMRETKVLLVTEACHMVRSMGAFKKAGLFPVAAPTHLQATEPEFSPRFYLPSAKGALWLETSWHEALGLVWYRLRGIRR